MSQPKPAAIFDHCQHCGVITVWQYRVDNQDTGAEGGDYRSNALTAATEMFMTRGLSCARDLHKHGWKLPIPRYDSNDPLHIRLSELGTTAERECQALVSGSDIPTKPAGDAQSRGARKMLRHEWQPNSKTAQAIETAVTQLLTDPTQAALAEGQMSAAQ